MTTAMTHEVKPPSVVLAEDVICQSFIQSSSTLAYACLLIRRGRHDLAAHVLHSLEQKPASRFKDMVFYLQAQIGIETGDFEGVKRRLASRAQQHPNDMVALSLLASCIHLEWQDWQHRNPAAASHTLAEERLEPQAEAQPSPEPPPAYHTLSVPTVPSAQAGFPAPEPVVSDALAALGRGPMAAHVEPPAPRPSAQAPVSADPNVTPLNLTAFAPSAPPSPAASGISYASGESDLGIFQSLASDPNTLAISLWNSNTRKLRTSSKRPDAEALVSALPESLPFGLSDAVRALDGGEVLKACFAFQALTVTSLHAGAENLGLVTGGLNQSLLTMVRAENTFHKAAHSGGGSLGAAAARVGAGAQ
jgi:hypothetical protein